MAILLKNEKICPSVMKLIYEKQLAFRTEANKIVSLEKTIERLLKDAYLKEVK